MGGKFACIFVGSLHEVYSCNLPSSSASFSLPHHEPHSPPSCPPSARGISVPYLPTVLVFVGICLRSGYLHSSRNLRYSHTSERDPYLLHNKVTPPRFAVPLASSLPPLHPPPSPIPSYPIPPSPLIQLCLAS